MYIRLAISISLKSVFGASHFFNHSKAIAVAFFRLRSQSFVVFLFCFLLHGRDVVYFFAVVNVEVKNLTGSKPKIPKKYILKKKQNKVHIITHCYLITIYLINIYISRVLQEPFWLFNHPDHSSFVEFMVVNRFQSLQSVQQLFQNQKCFLPKIRIFILRVRVLCRFSW